MNIANFSFNDFYTHLSTYLVRIVISDSGIDSTTSFTAFTKVPARKVIKLLSGNQHYSCAFSLMPFVTWKGLRINPHDAVHHETGDSVSKAVLKLTPRSTLSPLSWSRVASCGLSFRVVLPMIPVKNITLPPLWWLIMTACWKQQGGPSHILMHRGHQDWLWTSWEM